MKLLKLRSRRHPARPDLSNTPFHHAGTFAPGPQELKRGRLLVGLTVLLVWGLITHGTFAGSGDEPHYMMIAHSLAFDADLDLANDYDKATLIGGGALEPEAHAILHEGRLRPVHDVGMPLALAPVVRLAYTAAETLGRVLPASVLDAARLNSALILRHQMSLVMALLTGLLARELFLILLQTGARPFGAFAWALLFALTPPVLSHAFLFFTEIPTALLTLFVFRRLAVQPVSTAPAAALAGALTGFLLLVHARNVGIVAGLSVVGLLAAYRRQISARLLVIAVAGMAAAVLGRTLATFVLWGSFVTTPHAALGTFSGTGDIAREIFARGTGLLFDREYGLLAYGPIYLLAAPGLLLLSRHRPKLTRDLLIVVACYLGPVLLLITNVHGWTGGWSPAARFLVPVAPLAWLGVCAYAMGAARSGKALVAGMIVLQIGIDAFVWQFPKTLWNDGDGISALAGARWLPSWTDPAAALPFAIALAAAGAIAYGCWRYTVRTELSARRSAAVSLPRA